jgi:hypothetical protein
MWQMSWAECKCHWKLKLSLSMSTRLLWLIAGATNFQLRTYYMLCSLVTRFHGWGEAHRISSGAFTWEMLQANVITMLLHATRWALPEHCCNLLRGGAHPNLARKVNIFCIGSVWNVSPILWAWKWELKGWQMEQGYHSLQIYMTII